jgi:hypothetical protein
MRNSYVRDITDLCWNIRARFALGTHHSVRHVLALWFVEPISLTEDGGDKFLRNVGRHSTDYTVSYPTR